ncbi:MAG: hypothetical protein GX620_05260 [Chloroflexi bacterium]|nr:hypothetical protein [Chloroflexota bacterium]
MSRWIEIYKRIYTRILGIYPQGFRAVFRDEMTVVFEQAMEARPGASASLRFLLRELRDLPGSALRQHWLAIRQEESRMSTLGHSREVRAGEQQPSAWAAASLAGLPHLLMGILVGGSKCGFLQIQQASQTAVGMIGAGLALCVVGTLVYAWQRGWPLWSASWYLYGTWVSLVAIGLTIESLNLKESWRYTNAAFVGWILFCVFGYLIIVSKSRLHGLLSIAFLFPLLSTMMLEFIPNPVEGWLTLGVGSLAALATGAIIRIGRLRTALWVTLGSSLAAGLAWAYIAEYMMLDLPAGIPAHTPRFGGFLEMLALYSIFALGIVVLPFIAGGLYDLGRRRRAR